jgi:hypothetical protein
MPPFTIGHALCLGVRSICNILYASLLDHHKYGEREGSRMTDAGLILVTGAAVNPARSGEP